MTTKMVVTQNALQKTKNINLLLILFPTLSKLYIAETYVSKI